MPTYTYNCSKCDNTFTKMRSVNDRLTAECPRCNSIADKSDKVEAPGIQFKGSGWFKTSGGY